ncbi:sugar ABC transporter substrate-binding protein [Trinickia terrae]|uniref:Sugar ABC transporter substrate-binding protein n=1 Tax=Trinickia terrae TaxID=2571161 RepID=A0A4U1IG61_9BURK|nr:sugar ABC transporter substrate-binding protein [Trinickia terrae]
MTGAAPAASATTVGVVLAGSVLVFWQSMMKGIRHAADDLHVDLIMRSPSDGASLGTQANVQLQMVDYLVKSGVAGIVLAPEPLQGVKTPVSVTVPVVLVDRGSNDYLSVSTVETNNFEAGKTAARSLMNILHKGSTVAVLRLAPSIPSTTARENGFLSVAQEAGWNVVINTYVGYDFRMAGETARKLLAGYQGHLDAAFAPNETTAYGALQAVESMPPERRPRLVVFDWRPEFLDALKGGSLYADVVQDPYRMGYLAVETLVSTLRHRPAPPDQYVDVVTVTQGNMNEPAIRAVIANYNP